MTHPGGERTEGGPARLLTIGQLAECAGVTTRAIRHYHRRGLLAEPPRDSSGYRRYGAEHAVVLVKIRTLADAGVPLGRVGELLAADPEGFAAAMVEIDRDLRDRAAEILRTRERIAQLRAGDRPFVSPEVADYLDRLREAGVSERTVLMERDIWILLQAVTPQEAATWIADKRRAVGDAEFCAIYREYDAAFDWSADDPRLQELAARTRRWIAARDGRSGGREGAARDPSVDPTIVRLVATAAGATSQAWDRLTEIVRRSGAGG